MGRDDNTLETFYETLKEGVSVQEFLQQFKVVMEWVHERGLVKDFRIGIGVMKKLSDEVVPVARFARIHSKSDDKIRFSLDSSYPDCVIFHKTGRMRDIEVTLGQARKRFHIMSELNSEGTARGYINVPEDAHKKQFTSAMTGEREAYSTDQVIDCMMNDLNLRAQRKQHHQGDTLLIEAETLIIPPERWENFSAKFMEKVQTVKFEEVYLTGLRQCGDFCLRIK